MHVLIAEDDAVSRLILQKYITKLGHSCVVATNGLTAWERYQREEFDVVVSDWMMPEFDGPELVRRIRECQEERSCYTYVIMLTSLEDRRYFLEGMQAGADDYLLKPLDKENLQTRLISAERVTGLHRRLADQKAELELLNQKLYLEGRTDALTRLRNRLSMHEDLSRLHEQVCRDGGTYAVALCDIDHYKRFNDHYGHQEGDLVLQKVARALFETCRESDTVYRYGGEEFLVLLREPAVDVAAMVMERLRQAVWDQRIVHDKSPFGHVSISVGVSIHRPLEGASVDALLREADDALYHAKENGRNCVAVFNRSGTALLADLLAT